MAAKSGRHEDINHNAVEWCNACIRMGKVRTDVTHPPSGSTDFPRMCRHRFASIAAVTYVVDIGSRWPLIIRAFFFTVHVEDRLIGGFYARVARLPFDIRLNRRLIGK